MADEIDTTNKFMVGMNGGGLAILIPPHRTISNADAILLAAWLVALADPGGERFSVVLEAIQST